MERGEVQHKPFWAFMAAIFLLSLIVIISSVDGTLNLSGNVVAEPSNESLPEPVHDIGGFLEPAEPNFDADP